MLTNAWAERYFTMPGTARRLKTSRLARFRTVKRMIENRGIIQS
jgi:hypothetical protein